MSDMKGFTRDKDGVLVWQGGIGNSYRDPGEAVKFHYAGKLHFGCTERRYGLMRSASCDNAAKYDPDANGNPTKCGNHSKAAYERRNAKKDATEKRWRQQWQADAALREAQSALEPALRQIVQGHNNPRELAFEVLERLHEAREAQKAAHKKE